MKRTSGQSIDQASAEGPKILQGLDLVGALNALSLPASLGNAAAQGQHGRARMIEREERVGIGGGRGQGSHRVLCSIAAVARAV